MVEPRLFIFSNRPVSFRAKFPVRFAPGRLQPNSHWPRSWEQ